MFHLHLFGGASIDGTDGPVTGRAVQRHRLALLSLLAASPAPGIRRDKLITYLWPESGSVRARHALSDSLYRLNGALGGNALVAVGDQLRLNTAVITTDVGAFRDAIDAKEWERAVQVYKGPFLDGFFLPETLEFEHWVEVKRDLLAGEYAQALESLAEQRSSQGDTAGAVSAWRQRAAQDRYDSRVALRLMEALIAAGNRAGALQYARIHAELMERDFDAQPAPEIAAIFERLRGGPATPERSLLRPL